MHACRRRDERQQGNVAEEEEEFGGGERAVFIFMVEDVNCSGESCHPDKEPEITDDSINVSCLRDSLCFTLKLTKSKLSDEGHRHESHGQRMNQGTYIYYEGFSTSTPRK